ncbi:hypothetical protein D9M68_664430 [compost metagenome]
MISRSVRAWPIRCSRPSTTVSPLEARSASAVALREGSSGRLTTRSGLRTAPGPLSAGILPGASASIRAGAQTKAALRRSSGFSSQARARCSAVGPAPGRGSPSGGLGWLRASAASSLSSWSTRRARSRMRWNSSRETSDCTG